MTSLDTLWHLARHENAEVRASALDGLKEAFEVREKRQETYELLFNALFQIVHARTSDEALRLITRTAAQAARAEGATFFRAVPERGVFVFAEVAGDAAGVLVERELPMESGIVGEVARTKEPVVRDGGSSVSNEMAEATGVTTRNIVAVPVLGKEGEVLGVLEAVNKQGGSFTEEDVDSLALLAQNLTIVYTCTLFSHAH